MKFQQNYCGDLKNVCKNACVVTKLSANAAENEGDIAKMLANVWQHFAKIIQACEDNGQLVLWSPAIC